MHCYEYREFHFNAPDDALCHRRISVAHSNSAPTFFVSYPLYIIHYDDLALYCYVRIYIFYFFLYAIRCWSKLTIYRVSPPKPWTPTRHHNAIWFHNNNHRRCDRDGIVLLLLCSFLFSSWCLKAGIVPERIYGGKSRSSSCRSPWHPFIFLIDCCYAWPYPQQANEKWGWWNK